jgi:hypothetical protein
MRHAKFFVLPLLIAIVPFSLFSQSATWAKIYHRNPSTGLGYLFGTSIARTPSGAFFISSYVDAYKFNLLKINAAGDILWSKSYLRDDPLGSNLSTNRPIVAATWDEGCAVGWGSYLIKVDANGSAGWTKRYDIRARDDPNPYGFTFTFIHELEGGGYIIAGEKGYSRVIVARRRRDGALIWKTWYAGTGERPEKILNFPLGEGQEGLGTGRRRA